MNDYTVIGFYESNGQTFSDHVMATTAFEAMTSVAKGERDPEDVWIVACLPGYLYEVDTSIHFPGERIVSAETVLEQPDVFR